MLSNDEDYKPKKQPKIALCYWGMTRSTRFVYETHHKNVFDVLSRNGATYDVFIHTWKSEHNYIWDEDIPIEHDYEEYKLLNPTKYQLDNQDDFLKTINFDDYYYQHEKHREWCYGLIRNHICALESQQRCFKMCKSYESSLQNNEKYDFVIFIRPDSYFEDELPYNDIFENTITPFKKNTIIIPDDDWFCGYNDKFAITSGDMAILYAGRISEIKEYRKNYGPITAEKFLKYIIDKYYELRAIKFNFNITRPK